MYRLNVKFVHLFTASPKQNEEVEMSEIPGVSPYLKDDTKAIY
jgi:hypothetical protein